MSRGFASASSEFLDVSSSPVSGTPLTIAAWGRLTSSGDFTHYCVCSVTGNGRGDAFFVRMTGWDTNEVRVFANAVDNGGNVEALSGIVTPRNDTWYHVAGVFTSSTSRAAYINGGNKGTDTSSSAPTTDEEVLIGAERPTGFSNYFNGNIAEVGIWNVALSDAEIGELATGIKPTQIRPVSLVFYLPLVRDDDIDLVNGYSFSINGTPTVETHPPQIIYPVPKIWTLPPAAAPAGRTTKNTDAQPLGIHTAMSWRLNVP